MNGSGLASPGVYFREEISAPTEWTLRTGIPLLIGFSADGTSRGLTEITDWSLFTRLFGGLQPDSYLAYAVRGFFVSGGKLCYVATLQREGDVGAALASLLGAAGQDSQLDNIDLVCFPDAVLLPERTVALQRAILDFCRRDAQGRSHYLFAILDSAAGADSDEVIKQKVALVLNNAAAVRSGALNFPWLLLEDGPAVSLGFVPSSGHVAGIYAAKDRSGGFHQAPANVELEDVLDLQAAVDSTLQQTLNPAGINCLRAFPGRGIRLWGARTLSTEPEWTYVNVRRLFLTVCRWVERYMERVAFEPNDQPLWLRVTREINNYLTGLYRQGAFQGETLDEAFYVRCDASTNTREVRDLGQMVAEIGLAPAVPGEFIVIRIVQGDGGTTVSSGSDSETVVRSAVAAPVSEVPILHIEADPAGADVAGEYLLLANRSGRSLEMTNWRLRDRAGHQFVFPRFFLAAEARLRIWTKHGENGANDLFWGSDNAIWNNAGDSAVLYDSQDHLISTYTYTGKS